METILLAEDHNLIAEGYRIWINKIDNLEIIGVAIDGQQAIEMVKLHRPNYLILDLHMPKANGLEVLKQVSKYSPETKVIIISMYGDPSIHREVIKLGAKAYLLKNSDVEEFMLAIDWVMKGKSYYSPAIFEEQSKIEVVSSISPVIPVASLTPREKEVLILIAQGYTNKEMGQKLFVSHKTIDTHRTNIMKKLGAHSISDLVKYAIANGYDV